MLHLLRQLVERLPFRVQLIAVHLDQRQPGYDGQRLISWLKDNQVPFEILQEDTYSVVREKLQEGQTYCSLCSRLRRGILYTAAERLGCNKIALGHHRDDALETLLLNLFYAGRLQAMPAKYTTDDGRFDVIRPLIECAEKDIQAFATVKEFPILPCNLCGSQTNLKRDAMTALLDRLETENPHIRSIMINALRNVSPSHFLDRDLAQVWQARPANVRPKHRAPPRTHNHRALPLLQSKPKPGTFNS